MADDEKWMARALALARRGMGRVHPNPMVGAVLVRNESIVGEGYHHAFGQPHAEAEALRRAGPRAKGALLFINLEPCSHWGKTPPCAQALISAGVREVVAAMQDPNPLVSGKGFAVLSRYGVRVRRGILEKEAQELNRAFSTWVRHKRPYVTLKAATSLDGKIATAARESKWITGPAARGFTHRLRAEVDAIAVGSHTVLQDQPSLTAHGKGRNPIRIVFDSRLRIPIGSRVLDRKAPTWIFTTSRSSPGKRRALERKGTAVYLVPHDRTGRVSIGDAAVVMAREGIAHLMVEGGGTLHAAFLEAGLADEVVWFIAPMLIGGAAAITAVEGRGAAHLKKAWRLHDASVERVGEDFCVKGKVRF